MHARLTLFLLLYVFLSCPDFAQDRAKIDSVLSVIQHPSQTCNNCYTDTVVINACTRLGARFYGNVPDTALYYLNQSISFCDAALKKQPKGMLFLLIKLKKATAINEKGWVYYSMGNYEESIGCFHRSMQMTAALIRNKNILLKNKAKKVQIFNYGGLGAVYTYKNDYPKALENCFAALKLAESIGNKKGMAANLGNIGNIYSSQSDFNKALKYHLRALAINEESGDKIGQSVNLGNIGIAYDYLGKPEEALAYYFKALHLSEELGNKSDQAIDLASIAGLYSFKGKLDEAQDYYLKALAIHREIENKQGETNVTGNVGMTYIKQKKYVQAEKYLERFYQLAMDLHSLYEIQYAHEYLAELYTRTGRYEDALKHYKWSVQYRDSITNEENTRASLEKEVQFNYDKKAAADSVVHAKAQEVKNAEIARQNAEISARKNQQYLLYGGLALVLIFAAFMYNRFRVTSRQKAIIEQKEKETQRQNEVIARQKHMVEDKHKEITDSINYAERIQRSFMATRDMLDENLKEYFVLFQPKDVVSGDFYWATQKFENLRFEDLTLNMELQSDQITNLKHQTSNAKHYPNIKQSFYLAVADSTGHGVPGAIMSLLNIYSLEKAVEKYEEPNEILNETRKTIIERLKKDGSAEGGKDGMDCALLRFDVQSNKLVFALANNPLWLVRQGEIREFAPDKMPVGKHDRDQVSFTRQEVEINKGDMVYVFTDGYADQFGGDKGKKFKYANLQKLLVEHAHRPVQDQYQKIVSAFENWKGDLEQIDDVCIIGIRL